MRALLIYNPAAANGRAGKLLAPIRDLAQARGLDLEVVLTERPGHATEIAKAVDLGRFGGILAGGGDGTVFEVVNGYFQNPTRARVPFGVLPVGTGNAFARDLDLATGQIDKAIARVARDHSRAIDVGRFRAGGTEAYFLNILGLGFVSDVTATARRLKALGNISYTLGVLYQTVFLRSTRMTLRIGGTVYERDAIFCEISNTRYTSNFMIAPDALIDDGLLDVVILNRISRLRLLRFFPSVFTGRHVHLDEVETFASNRIRVSTDVPKVLSPDGELTGSTPAEVECLPAALPVFG